MRLLFELFSVPLLKSGLGLTISHRPEQVYLPLDQDWNDLERAII